MRLRVPPNILQVAFSSKRKPRCKLRGHNISQTNESISLVYTLKFYVTAVKEKRQLKCNSPASLKTMALGEVL